MGGPYDQFCDMLFAVAVTLLATAAGGIAYAWAWHRDSRRR